MNNTVTVQDTNIITVNDKGSYTHILLEHDSSIDYTDFRIVDFYETLDVINFRKLSVN